MPDSKDVERAAEHFALEELDADATWRASSTGGRWNAGEDPFGADVLAQARHVFRIQASKSDPRTEKRKKLERLGQQDGEFIPPVQWERRLILWWSYERHGQTTRHFFKVEELVWERPSPPKWATWDGTNRRVEDEDGNTWVWAKWKDRVRIPGDTRSHWYEAAP